MLQKQKYLYRNWMVLLHEQCYFFIGGGLQAKWDISEAVGSVMKIAKNWRDNDVIIKGGTYKSVTSDIWKWWHCCLCHHLKFLYRGSLVIEETYSVAFMCPHCRSLYVTCCMIMICACCMIMCLVVVSILLCKKVT